MSVLSKYIYGGQPAPTLEQSSLQQTAQFAQAWLDEPMPVGMGTVPTVTQPTEANWFTKIAKPVAEFGQSLFTGAAEVIEYTRKELPEIYEWGMGELGLRKRTVQEGPGRSTTYIERPVAGGSPWDELQQRIGQAIGRGVYQAGKEDVGPTAATGVKLGSIVLIGGILLILYLALKK